MKISVSVALLTGLIILTTSSLGCRKRAAEQAAPALPAEPLFKVASAASTTAQLKLLTDAMTTWEDQNSGRVLTNLSQLVESRIIDQLPAPPAGRKFVIDGQRHQVVLGAQ